MRAIFLNFLKQDIFSFLTWAENVRLESRWNPRFFDVETSRMQRSGVMKTPRISSLLNVF